MIVAYGLIAYFVGLGLGLFIGFFKGWDYGEKCERAKRRKSRE